MHLDETLFQSFFKNLHHIFVENSWLRVIRYQYALGKLTQTHCLLPLFSLLFVIRLLDLSWMRFGTIRDY